MSIDVTAALGRARREMIETYGAEEVSLPHSLEAYGVHGVHHYTLTPLDLLTEEEREAYYADMRERSERAAAEEYAAQKREEAETCPLCGKPLGGEQFFHLDCAHEEQARADYQGE